ncbi:protein ENHANCED DISEASE RESISTANCE 2-like isoform X3 [Vigna unguiculata]|uniref:protein ENHANCED DISEASE RESISTANCE 2-like isoform X3 n=1 Tax=Vigna unguiculata TaxID=3917 RepID=UPI00101639A0|nr:protein ENHANCED DISEASE RESISTANCE 2-like isoform X3 [Vigna unguiculata]
MDAVATASELNKSGSGGSERSDDSGGGGGGIFEYSGWVYHLGVNSIGHEYCHLRFLFIRGKYVAMYKRDPHENPGIIACATAGEARGWMEAFDQAKQQAELELSKGISARDKLNNMENEINLEGHRPRVRRYAHGLRKLIRIGQGPEKLLRQSSKLSRTDGFEGDGGDAVEAHQWKCIFTLAGIRIFEDVSDHKNGKTVLAKSVGVIDATADTVFEVILSTDQQKRYEWDTLICDLELVDSYDGHYDVVYGTYDSKYLSRWHSKQDFVFSRQWFRGQDGTYTILQCPAIHKKKPPIHGYRRAKVNPSSWEIRNLNTSVPSNSPRCLVTHTLEINTSSWCRWKNHQSSKFQRSIPHALLFQVAGLKEYIAANPALHHENATTVVHSKISDASISSAECEDEMQDEFYDAITADSSTSDEESDDDQKLVMQEPRVKLKNISWAITTLALKRTAAPDLSEELDPHVTPITIPSDLHCSLWKGKDDNDTNCWASPSGKGFMIRGKNYLKDSSKVVGGDPLLKLVGVDWLTVDKSVDRIALHPKCLVQSEAGKKLPFILVINLQVPAKPNYSLVLYYAADRPINKNSLLAKFVGGSDAFRDSRFKLIPSIVEGYWMVKRAVGTKACLLGKAVTCKYFRQDNFLEIDVDIGSSSVARSVIGLVLGYVTSLVVDLAILIEAKEEPELPEYILGTVRLNRLKLESAVPLED